MKMPEKPPRTKPLWDTLLKSGPEKIGKILSSGIGPTVEGRYLHWEKLRHRAPPNGLTSEEWWFAIKNRRTSLSKQLPLLSKKQHPFTYGLVDPIPEQLHLVDLGAGGLIQMPDQLTNPETKDQYYVSSLIEEAITSSQLEGATTTRLVAKEMIREGRPPQDRSEQMILNNYMTMQRIGSLKDRPLSMELVFELHRQVTDKTLDNPDAAGRFRHESERIYVGDDYGEVFHDPPTAHELNDRMAALCDFANGKTPAEFIHPAIRSVLLHFWLAYDHPFVDGNGRTARALFYWSMLRHKFWLCEFLSISHVILKAPIKYYTAFLHTETDENDATYFILYHLDVLRKAIDELHEYIGRKTKELKALEARLRAMGVLNNRQRALISHALRHPHHRYTIESHKTSQNVVYQTARTDLLDLVDRGFLQTEKAGRTFLFVPVSDLEKRLSRS
jgi:Fic family protein